MHQDDTPSQEPTTEQLERRLQWSQALNALIRFGVKGEMIAVGHLDSGTIIFITNEQAQDENIRERRAFAVLPDLVVIEGLWSPDPERHIVRVQWFGVETAQEYDMRGLHLNPYCQPLPE